MKIQAVCVGRPEKCPGRSYRTGIFKVAVSGPVLIDGEGVVGDAICNRKHHGGVDQAVYVEGSLTLDWWQGELGRSLAPGTFGENLVIEDLDNREIAVGDRFRAGEILLEVTAPRTPCATFAARMGDPNFVRHYAAALRPGIYCRVIAGGMLKAGEPVTFQPYDGPRVLLPEVMLAIANRPDDATRERLFQTPLAHRFRSRLEG